MRIIAGTHRGRSFLAPADDLTTRPITDRVKEALFNRLHSLGVLGYGQVLDVFCGTGSMGLEALSRGAAFCTFVDQDRSATQRVQENLETFDLDAKARVVQGSALSLLWLAAVPDGSITLSLVDPPYLMAETQMPDLLQLLGRMGPKLEPGGVVVMRTPVEVPPPAVDNMDGPASFDYGKMTLHFYQSPLPTTES